MSTKAAPRRSRGATALLALLLAATCLSGLACRTDATAQASERVPGLFEIAAQLAQRRAENLARLDAYRRQAIYPRNRVVADAPANVFIDEDGHRCAVANLMWLDGQHDLVASTAREDNLVVLRNVHQGPLYDWILASGFTQEEINQIQEPYMPVDPNDPNFGPNEDKRLDDHFVQLEQQLQTGDAASILEAARRQRAEILARYGDQ